MSSRLLDKAKSLPKLPGCYLMKNKSGEVIYVGKARDLKNRVTSYFNQSAKNAKTEILVSKIEEFDFILTQTDVESFVLENNLIKQYSPKYNIRLKDDKSYPYIIVQSKNDFPRLQYVRRPKREKNVLMFGPYPQGYSITPVIKALNKAFQLRDCSDYELKSRKTPCLLYQIHQCSGPCVGKISQADYQEQLVLATDYLHNGKKAKKSLNYLNSKMMEFAENESFEKAAVLRDQLVILNEFLEKNNQQQVENLTEEFMDIIAFHVGSEDIDISIYMIRSGNLLGHKNFHFPLVDLVGDIEDEILSFILQYYSLTNEEMPKVIVSDFSPDNKKILESAIYNILKQEIKVVDKTNKFQSLLETTRKNAQENQRIRQLSQNSVFVALNKLKDILELNDRPRTLECFDVAIWQGKSPTASQVCFHDGKADKNKYRHYHLSERPEGNNDFEMMKELFQRRVDNGHLPDVFIVDGGKGQLNIVKKVLDEAKINIPVVSIAKSKILKTNNYKDIDITKTEERLFLVGRSNPIILNKSPSLFKLMTEMRDEAHRFSRVLHHKAESKRFIKSWVDDLENISESSKKNILKKIDLPVDSLLDLTAEELKEKFDLTPKEVRSIINYIQKINLECE